METSGESAEWKSEGNSISESEFGRGIRLNDERVSGSADAEERRQLSGR